MDPKKGIESLIASGLLNDVPEDLAVFLYKGERLNKTKVSNHSLYGIFFLLYSLPGKKFQQG